MLFSPDNNCGSQTFPQPTKTFIFSVEYIRCNYDEHDIENKRKINKKNNAQMTSVHFIVLQEFKLRVPEVVEKVDELVGYEQLSNN